MQSERVADRHDELTGTEARGVAERGRRDGRRIDAEDGQIGVGVAPTISAPQLAPSRRSRARASPARRHGCS